MNDEETPQTQPIENAPSEPEASPEADALRRTVSRYREMLLAANPDSVPELVRGDDVESLDRSLAEAKAAFARAKEAARLELVSGTLPSNPQRRDAPPPGIENAGPLAKIAWGLRKPGRS